MNSTIIKRSIVLNGHKTSVSLENEFWSDLRGMAVVQNTNLTKLVEQIDRGRNGGNLSSAIRVFLFNRLHAQLASARVSSNQKGRIEVRAFQGSSAV
jgi:predicted DNA-binding ribbon-helix-helix protein